MTTTAEPALTTRPRGKRTSVPAATASRSTSSALDTLTAPAASSARSLVPTAVLHAHPANPAHRSDADFEELAEAIRAEGEIVDALVVRPHPTIPDEYQVVSGHRRLAAAQFLGMALVPVRVKILDDASALVGVLSANQDRRDFTNVEEARLVQATLDLPDMTQKALAARLGKSPSWVSERARAAKTPARILDKLADSSPTFEVLETIREFEGTDDADQLVEAFKVGPGDYKAILSTIRRNREYKERDNALAATLKAAGIKPVKGTTWSAPEGFREAKQCTRTNADDDNLTALLTELGADKTWRYRLSSWAIFLYRPLTEKELAKEAAKTVRQKAADVAREAHHARVDALRETVHTARITQEDHLADVIKTRKLTTAQQTAITDYFAASASSELFSTASLYLSGYRLTGLLSSIAHTAESNAAWAASLTPPMQMLMLAAAYGLETCDPEAWIKHLDDVQDWYTVLTALGYQPSTAETTALAENAPETGQ